MSHRGRSVEIRSVGRLHCEYFSVVDVHAILQPLPIIRPSAKYFQSGSIDALWVVQNDFELHLFLSARGVNEMLHAIGYDIPTILNHKSSQYLDICVCFKNRWHKLSLCPTHWKVRDVLVAIGAQHPAFWRRLSLEAFSNLEVVTKEKDKLSMQQYLEDITCTTWFVSILPMQADRTLMLRGFPFKYGEDDVRAFMRYNGVHDADIEDMSLVRSAPRSPNPERFLGLVQIVLSTGADKKSCVDHLHLAPADSRYIEVLPFEEFGKFKFRDRDRYQDRRSLLEESSQSLAIIVPLPT